MNVVDSSAWLEYFGDGDNAPAFAAVIEAPETLVVPTPTVYEVYKRIHITRDEASALAAVATMMQSRVVDLTAGLALDAARLSIETGLAMADSIILATAQAEGATLWTQDADFAGMPQVEYRAKTA
jgi:predicted nucleic acid-binding protein